MQFKWDPSVKEFVGQIESIARVELCVSQYKKERKKALLIHGPSGTGKTSFVHALAKELDLEILEVNASDIRNKDAILKLVGESGMQMSLFSKGKIILVDELEGISGNADRGGVQALLDVFDTVRFPLILTTNDPDLDKLETLKSTCEVVEFEPLSTQDVCIVLERACAASAVTCAPAVLKQLARMADGDVRSSLIDLDLITVDGKVREELFEVIGRFSRDALHAVMVKLMKGSNVSIAQESLQTGDVDVVDVSRTIVGPVLYDNSESIQYVVEENLPYEYGPEDLEKAFDSLSKSDLFHGRISRWQYYRFLVYVQGLVACCAIKSSKNEKPFEMRLSRRSPKNNKGLWFIMDRRRDLVAEKIAVLTHASKRRVKKDMFFYRMIFKNKISDAVIKDFKFDEKDVAWLVK